MSQRLLGAIGQIGIGLALTAGVAQSALYNGLIKLKYQI